MKKSNRTTLAVCFCIAMIATIIFYLLAVDNIFTVPMFWLSLVFLLIAEMIGTIKALKIEGSIFGTANIMSSLIHILVVLGISLVFVNIFPVLVTQYILINLLLIAVIAVTDLVTLYFGTKAKEENKQHASSRALVDECYRKAEEMSITFAQSEHAEGLREISDMLKYSDHTDTCGNEKEILGKLYELRQLFREDGSLQIEEMIKQIQNLIKVRSAQIKQKKKGSF